jgi:hypothetical protein
LIDYFKSDYNLPGNIIEFLGRYTCNFFKRLCLYSLKIASGCFEIYSGLGLCSNSISCCSSTVSSGIFIYGLIIIIDASLNRFDLSFPKGDLGTSYFYSSEIA